jgi:hypothetical protein
MIRFLRSIRQELMNENKAFKYLKYAVGEILLVMIGILLALSVNNWNEGRKLEDQKRELIENLKSDFKTNLNRLDESIAIGDAIVVGLTDFLKVSAGETTDISVEEIRILAHNAFLGLGFRPAMGAFQSGTEKGLITYIEDSSLKELFIDFEHALSKYESLEEVILQDQFIGSIMRLRDKLGSLHGFYDTTLFKTNASKLSDQEYWKFIGQKEVYSAFENKYSLKNRQLTNLHDLKETTEKILVALEGL